MKDLGPLFDLESRGCSQLDDDSVPCRIILHLVWSQNISLCICTHQRETGLLVEGCVLVCLSTSFCSCPHFTALLSQWKLLHQDRILNRQQPEDLGLGSLPGQLEAGRGNERPGEKQLWTAWTLARGQPWVDVRQQVLSVHCACVCPQEGRRQRPQCHAGSPAEHPGQEDFQDALLYLCSAAFWTWWSKRGGPAECSVYTEHFLRCSRTWADIQQPSSPPRKQMDVNTGPLFPLPQGQVLGELWLFQFACGPEEACTVTNQWHVCKHRVEVLPPLGGEGRESLCFPLLHVHASQPCSSAHQPSTLCSSHTILR